jgi:hypothetical protein
MCRRCLWRRRCPWRHRCPSFRLCWWCCLTALCRLIPRCRRRRVHKFGCSSCCPSGSSFRSYPSSSKSSRGWCLGEACRCRRRWNRRRMSLCPLSHPVPHHHHCRWCHRCRWFHLCRRCRRRLTACRLRKSRRLGRWCHPPPSFHLQTSLRLRKLKPPWNRPLRRCQSSWGERRRQEIRQPQTWKPVQHKTAFRTPDFDDGGRDSG